MTEIKYNDLCVQDKTWAIFVINSLQNVPNQVHYQRIITLAENFNLIVVTTSHLPPALEELVREIYLTKKGFILWRTVINVARGLQQKGQKVYVHTQYSPAPAIAGFLCKYRTDCKWVYDLWDHPTLGYELIHGPSRWVRQIMWFFIKRYLLIKADAWIVAMHPGILAYMPPAPVTCRLIFTQPGSNTDLLPDANKKFIVRENVSPIKVAYAGPVILQRGLGEIRRWALQHRGVPVELHLIGLCKGDESQKVLDTFKGECEHNSDLKLVVYGKLPHADTLKVLESSHIGICPLETTVLNYRFAYPIKVVEQMRLGLIVVGTATHGISSFINDGINGFLAKPERGGLGKALQKAISCCLDSEKALTLQSAAMETVKDNSWSTINNRLTNKIQSIIFE